MYVYLGSLVQSRAGHRHGTTREWVPLRRRPPGHRHIRYLSRDWRGRHWPRRSAATRLSKPQRYDERPRSCPRQTADAHNRDSCPMFTPGLQNPPSSLLQSRRHRRGDGWLVTPQAQQVSERRLPWSKVSLGRRLSQCLCVPLQSYHPLFARHF